VEFVKLDGTWTSGPRLPFRGDRDTYPAEWSPDARWLLVTARGRIWKVPVSGIGPVRPLARGGSPVWSPDGGSIAFVSTRDGDADIYVMRSDGSGERQLTHNNWADFDPDW
jgi:TolB protein